LEEKLEKDSTTGPKNNKIPPNLLLNFYLHKEINSLSLQVIKCKFKVKDLTEAIEKGLRKIGITVSKPVLAVLCIIFGVLIIVVPQLLAYLLGIFLIIEGILLLTEHLELQKQQPTQPSQPSEPSE